LTSGGNKTRKFSSAVAPKPLATPDAIRRVFSSIIAMVGD
jgi:hypothetical protein